MPVLGNAIPEARPLNFLDGLLPVMARLHHAEKPRLTIIKLGQGDLGVGTDEDLLIDAAHALQIADVVPHNSSKGFRCDDDNAQQ